MDSFKSAAFSDKMLGRRLLWLRLRDRKLAPGYFILSLLLSWERQEASA
jgi:hypothetical protein